MDTRTKIIDLKSNSIDLHSYLRRPFSLFCSKVLQQNNNCYYPDKIRVCNAKDLLEAVSHDYVCAEYNDNKRSVVNFVTSDCLAMDIDNDHSDLKSDWVTPGRIAKDFNDVQFAVHYSRNHMLRKNGKSARPKFHVLFPINEIDNADKYSAMKERLIKLYPYFDKGAKDAARFFFGTANPQVQLFYGTTTVDEHIKRMSILKFDINDILAHDNEQHKKCTESIEINSISEKIAEEPMIEILDDVKDVDLTSTIPQGERNDTCFKYACKKAKEFSNDLEMGHALFLKYCKKCVPPLPEEEQAKIWEQGIKYAQEDKKGKKEKKEKMPAFNSAILETELNKLGIKVKLNVFSRRLAITGIPENSKYIPKKYKDLKNKQQIAEQLLEAFLNPYLKDKGYRFSKDDLINSINIIAKMNPLNPVYEMIKDIEWDGQQRISTLYKILGIEQKEKSKLFLFKWLLQSLSLAINNDDGKLSADFVLVLQGKQGIGKTEFFRCITPRELFKGGAIIDTKNKDTIIEATSYWITELGEVDATFKKEQAELKAFITNNNTEYRRPYERYFECNPRRTSFCATVNPEQFLRDETGSRRYVVIKVDNIDCKSLHEIVDNDYFRAQLWREVYECLIKSGIQSYRLNRKEIEYIEAANIKSTVNLPGELEIYDLLDWNLPPEKWIFYSIPRLIEQLNLKNITSQQLGKTLTKMIADDNRIEKKKNNKGFSYKLPRSKN